MTSRVVQSFRRWNLAGMICCALLLSCDLASAAIVEPFDLTPVGRRSEGPYMIGYDFTVGGSNITINSLGVEDITNAGGAGYGDGTFAATQVGIWNSGGTLLGSATVKAGKQSPIINGFRYEPLATSVTLMAGQSYTIGSQKGGGVDYFSDGGAAANYVAGGGVTLTASRVNGSVTFAKPVSAGTLSPGRWSGGNATFVASAPENTPAFFDWVGPTGGGSVTERNDFAGTVGYTFTTGAQATQVRSLGFLDHNLDGLATAHRVAIWDATTQAKLAEVTVAAGTTEVAYEFFRYHALASPLDLLPNTTYWIGAEVFNGGDIWYDNNATMPFNPSTDPFFAGFSVGQGAYRPAAYNFPTNFAANRYYLAPNFLLTVVPEPATVWLLGIGALGLVWRFRRHARCGQV